tara:strand:- start:908 stop:1150 length:243 start_codon:yes stop_codon:yes gene_type:complete
MTTPGNQELLEMIQILEQRVVQLQNDNLELERKVMLLGSDLDGAEARFNRMIEMVVTKGQFNTSIRTFARFGLDDPRGRL